MTNESVTSKMAFYKRTKRKKVVRIVREKYLHNVKNYGFKHGGEKELSQSKLKELIINSKKKHLIELGAIINEEFITKRHASSLNGRRLSWIGWLEERLASTAPILAPRGRAGWQIC